MGKKFLEINKYEDAYNFLQKGCNLNDAESCFLAGVLEYNRKSDKSAEFYFSKSCNLDSENGCFYKKLYFSNLKKFSEKELDQLYQYYCKRDNEEACALSYLLKYKDSESENYTQLLNLCERRKLEKHVFLSPS